METINTQDIQVVKVYTLTYKYTHPMFPVPNKYFATPESRQDYINRHNVNISAYDQGHTLAFLHAGYYYTLNAQTHIRP